MSTPDEHPTTPASEPETDQEAAFLAAYRNMDEADRVQLWSEVLTLLDQQASRSAPAWDAQEPG